MQSKFHVCSHCHGAEYVFVSWLERMLGDRGMHLTDIQADIFKMIPVEHFVYCHCNSRIVFLNRKFTACQECDGTTWRLTEIAEHKGYFRRKIRSLSWQGITQLPCYYFERCSCGHEPKSCDEKEQLEVILGLMDNTVSPFK